MQDKVFINFINEDYNGFKECVAGYMQNYIPINTDTRVRVMVMVTILCKFVPFFGWYFNRKVREYIKGEQVRMEAGKKMEEESKGMPEKVEEPKKKSNLWVPGMSLH